MNELQKNQKRKLLQPFDLTWFESREPCKTLLFTQLQDTMLYILIKKALQRTTRWNTQKTDIDFHISVDVKYNNYLNERSLVVQV